MSTSTPSTPATGGSGTTHTHGIGAHRRHGQPGNTGNTSDPFASLLALLNATGDASSVGADPMAAGPGTGSKGTREDRSNDDADKAAQNPLAALMAWSGTTPASGNATVQTAVAANANRSAAGTATADGATAFPGHPLQARRDAQPALLMPETGPLSATQAATAPADTPAVTPGAPGIDMPPAERGAATSALPATRITAWRSTTTLAHAGGACATGPGHAAGPRAGEPSPTTGRAAEQAMAAQAGAFSPTGNEEAPTPRAEADPLLVGARGAAGEPATAGAAGTAGDGTGQMAGGQTGDGGSPQQDAPRHAQDAGQAPDSADRDDNGAADWTSPHVRHANVRVGDPGDNPIDIQLSVDGQAVQVSFQTDDAQARDSLARDASAALGELLQRSGMELDNVSVGGQSLPSQQQSGDQAQGQRAPRTPAAARAPDEATPAPAGDRPPRPAGGDRPLDLFV